MVSDRDGWAQPFDSCCITTNQQARKRSHRYNDRRQDNSIAFRNPATSTGQLRETMDSRKRRVSEILPLDQQHQGTTSKKTNRSVFTEEMVAPCTSMHTDLPMSYDEAPAVASTQKPTAKIITPQNSFHELRRVSVLSREMVAVVPQQTEHSTISESSSHLDDDVAGIFDVSEDDETISTLNGGGGALTTSSAPNVVIERPTSRVSPVDALETLPVQEPAAQPKEVVRQAVPDTSRPVTQQQHSGGWVVVMLATLLFLYSCFASTPVVLIDDPNSIYVPGGGFSGFWFTLGRLNSIEEPLDHRYYCYSAGCLGVATMLSNITMQDAYGYAVGVQKQWQRGEISRYDVTESFIDDLLYGDTETKVLRPAFADDRVLSSLRIITSERHSYMGVKTAIRTPENADELKDMLLQTAWIPFAISRDLWHDEHMDGAFTLHSHPRCRFQLGYDKMEWDLMMNALNVNLGYDKVRKFWERGLQLGLQQ